MLHSKPENKILRFTFFMLLSLFILTNVNATVLGNWFYDFNYPNALDAWHVSHGKFSTENGMLEVTECVVIYGTCQASIWNNSTGVVGIWSFDYYHNNTQNSHGLYFYFVGLGITEGDDDAAGWHPRYAYAMSIGKNGGSSLFYQPDANTLFPIWFDSSPSLSDPNGWFHYEITRNSTGYMNVLRNDTLILEATDNNITSSEYINFQFEYDSKIDNVCYTSEIDGDRNCGKIINSQSDSKANSLFFDEMIAVMIFTSQCNRKVKRSYKTTN